jgi:hypothetical protein
MLTAWHEPAGLPEYASSPTPFWLVKLMDLGLVVPAALTTAVGLWRHRGWAARAAHVVFTAYTCVGLSVACMALVMLAHGDPDASPAMAAGFGLFALAFVALTVALYRPLFATRRRPEQGHGAEPYRWAQIRGRMNRTATDTPVAVRRAAMP